MHASVGMQTAPMDQGSSQREGITAALLAGGSVAELAAGATAIILTVIGLAGGAPLLMAGIATLVAGAGVLAHGASVAARWRQIAGTLDGDERGLVGGGVGLELVGGASAIVLAVLALAGVLPGGMLAAAAVVLGGSLVLAGAVPPQLAIATSEMDVDRHRRIRSLFEIAGGTLVLAGIAGALLGIFGLVDIGPAIAMALVAMLVLGGALTVAGGAGALKFARALTAAYR
jgi:hypothetical protein